MNCDLENAMVLPEPPASDWQADAAYAAEQADQRNDSRASDELFQIISGAVGAQARAAVLGHYREVEAAARAQKEQP